MSKSALRATLRWINPADVTWEASSTSNGRRKVRDSRASSPSRYKLAVVHLPTHVRSEGEVPLAHYTRAEMKKKKEDLWLKLWLELDEAVAQKLRLPKR
jgi:hypothetical protein